MMVSTTCLHSCTTSDHCGGLTDGCVLDNRGWCRDGMLRFAMQRKGEKKQGPHALCGNVMCLPEQLGRVQV